MAKVALKKPIRLTRGRRPAAYQQAALSPKDWIETATDFLIDNNVNGLDITDLCRRLGVTKGSFYWHFADRGHLLRTILDDWRKRMTLDVNLRTQRMGDAVEATLRYLLGLIRKPRPDRNAAIERSVRDWGRTDPVTRAAVVDVDRLRLASFEELFRRHGFRNREVRLRAYAAYALMMGDSILKDTIDLGYPAEEYTNVVAKMLLSGAAKPDTEV